jgi:hypothetical protein
MPLPTMSLRVAPEHQQLIRDIATAIRFRPELVDVLRDVLHTQHDGVAERDADVLQPVLDRLAALEVKKDALQSVLDRLTGLVEAHTDVLQPILDRLDVLERSASDSAPLVSDDGIADLAALAEVVKRRGERLDAMCRLYDKHEAAIADVLARLERIEGQAGVAVPARSSLDAVKPVTPGKRQSPTTVTDELRRQAHDLRASGQTRDAIAKALQLSGTTVSKIINDPRPAD